MGQSPKEKERRAQTAAAERGPARSLRPEQLAEQLAATASGSRLRAAAPTAWGFAEVRLSQSASRRKGSSPPKPGPDSADLRTIVVRMTAL